MKFKILIVDDEPNVRLFFQELLDSEEYETLTAGSAGEAREKGASFLPDIVFLDLKLPDANGLDLISPFKRWESRPQIIIISALGTVENAVKAVHLGAYHFITKPFDVDKITLTLERCCEYHSLSRKNRILRKIHEDCGLYQEFIGTSPAIEKIRKRILKLKNTDVPILITGETGTGKNILAKQIHHTINDPASPLVYINCSNISEQLFESELFGHEKGAFTGATERKRGRVEEAQGGSVILDEITEIPYSMQAKLLTFLQDKCFYRVGGKGEIRVDTRIIALTNRELDAEIEGGRFRKDLYYRLNVIRFQIPPLRERREDIIPLCRHFLDLFYLNYGGVKKSLDAPGFELLKNHPWPGNTRELKNQLERAYIYSEGDKLEIDELQGTADLPLPLQKGGLKAQLQSLERQLLIQALSLRGGNRRETASALQISLRNLQYKIAEYEIDL